MKKSNDRLAFDKSVRSFDVDGRLHVSVSNISKAMVCPYLGSEIPGAEALGLDPTKIYMLLRDPEELKKAAPTFRNLPLLIQHVPVSADKPRKDLVVGSTGSDAEFKAPYLSVSLSVWDSGAIAGIESKDQAELSSAYHYRADMTPGVYEGVQYDGIMRDIVGNHVALVDVGRAGSDVVVADKNPFKRKTIMTHKKRLLAAKDSVRSALVGKLAQDADITEIDRLFDRLAQDAEEEDKAEEEAKKAAEEAAAKKAAEDEDDDELYEDDPDNPGKRRKKVTAEDEDDEDKGKKEPEVTKAAMDSAIASAIKKTKADMEALHTARKEVAPMVGEVALDSAEAVYKFALDHAKIDTEGVHPSAYRAMVKMSLTEKPRVPPAQDSAAAKEAVVMFPALTRFSRS